MENSLITIIIDRVGNTNVFNLIHDKTVNNPHFEDSQSLQTIIDDDLIMEYAEELGRIANISRSLSSLPRGNEENQAMIFQHLNLSNKLRQIGEALYKQFFPESLQKYIRETEETFLFFHIDAKLASIPLEILHDGTGFLWEKFRLGKTVKGQKISIDDSSPRENLQMLIIADPREDLEWARREGEVLFEHLGGHTSGKRIHVELLGGKTINKLNLLNSIQGKDILHYAGHLHYSGNPDENGWLLYGNKILHAREFQKSGATPRLIFCNSCFSGRGNDMSDAGWYAKFAGSFVSSSSGSYIGTNWEMPDRQPTLEFTTRFYDNILSGLSIGECLQVSRKFAREHFSLNDLTWASYLLIGNPAHRIFRTEARLPDITPNILQHETVKESYPFPLALAYDRLTQISAESPGEKKKILQGLFNLFTETIYLVTAMILANHTYLKFPRQIGFPYPDMLGILDNLYQALGSMKALKTFPLAVNLLEAMYVHRESIYKIAGWQKKFQDNEILVADAETYEITVQFMLEALFMDLDFLRNYGFYIIVEPGHRQLNLMGLERYHQIRDIILPTQANAQTYEELVEKTRELVGKFVFYNPVKKTFLDLSPYIDVTIEESVDGREHYRLIYRERTVSLQEAG